MANKHKVFFHAQTILIIGTMLYFYLEPVSLKASAASDMSTVKENAIQLTPLFWTIAIIGGCITLTLTYVSWKKYKGEKKKQSMKKDKIVD